MILSRGINCWARKKSLWYASQEQLYFPSMKKVRELLFGKQLKQVQVDFWLRIISLAFLLKRSSRRRAASWRISTIWRYCADLCQLFAEIVGFAGFKVTWLYWYWANNSFTDSFWTEANNFEAAAGFGKRGQIVELAACLLVALGSMFGVGMLAVSLSVDIVEVDIVEFRTDDETDLGDDRGKLGKLMMHT